MDLGQIGWGGLGSMGLVQDRYKWRALVNAIMNLPTSGFSSGAQLHRASLVYVCMEGGENCIMRNFLICTLRQV
jgi:hypothetical protein